MKEIKVPYWSRTDQGTRSVEAFHAINEQPWAETDAASAGFHLSYTDKYLRLEFMVSEKHLMALRNQINQPVYKDSCVEFFIGFESGKGYYNFEFNCAGTALVGFGEGRERELLPVELIRSIKTEVSIKPELEGFISWNLLVHIPFQLFIKHNITTFKGLVCRGNFYKCGDDLPEPHYLAWNRIQSKEPNFHLPEFFGELIFE